MRLYRLLPAVLVAGSLGLAACDDDVTGVVISDFAGVWTATTVQYTAVADPSRTLQIVGLSGGGLTLTINATGGFEGVLTLPGPQPIPFSGSVTLVSQTQADIVFVWPEQVEQAPISDFRATFSLVGNTLTFSRDDATFQFPGQQAPETATLVIIMTRS